MTANIASIYIKTHFDHTYPEFKDRVTWLVPEQWVISDEELIARCKQHQVDILCTSHFIWNDSSIIEQLSRVRDSLPDDLIVCAGGPSVRVKVEDDYLKKHHYIDYAFFAQGETGFSDLLHSLLTGKKLIAFNTSNVGWYNRELDRQQVADFKYLPEPKISPYLYCEDYLEQIVKNTPDIDKILFPYQLTRGCPYSCTFCDWNGGFTNKTTRRKNTYRDEIDLFDRLGLYNLYLVDANIGQYDEDVQVVEYLVEKNNTQGTRFTFNGSYSKLNKKNNMKIWRLMAENNLLPYSREAGGFVLAVQDPNPQVLENIDRPDVGWEVHASMIQELQRDYPQIPISINIIAGLPGQSAQSYFESMCLMFKEPVTMLMCFTSEYLPTSPAALDPEYQKKFNFSYVHSTRYQAGRFFTSPIPESCSTFGRQDMVEMQLINLIFCSLSAIRYYGIIDMAADLGEIASRLLKTKELSILRENLYNNWVNENKFYYTRWFGPGMPEKIYTACHYMHLDAAYANKHYLMLVAQQVDKKYVNLEKLKKALNLIKYFDEQGIPDEEREFNW